MIYIGFCLPASCDETNIGSYLKLMSNNNIIISNEEFPNLPKLDKICQTKEDLEKDYSYGDYCAMYVND